jgi:hypothetical protein
MLPGLEDALEVAKQINAAQKGICSLQFNDSILMFISPKHPKA